MGEQGRAGIRRDEQGRSRMRVSCGLWVELWGWVVRICRCCGKRFLYPTHTTHYPTHYSLPIPTRNLASFPFRANPFHSVLIRDRERGMALILTLAIITILAVLVLEFSYLMRVEAEISGNFADSLKAYYLANSGVNFAFLLLREDDPEYDSLDEEWAEAMPPIAMEEGAVIFEIIDECGKINVNLLKGKRKKQDQMLRLCDLLNEEYGLEAPVSYGIVPAVIDWTDDDDDIEVLDFVTGENIGAEDEYYQGLEEPYSCKNRPLDTVEELLLVKGITDEIFSGRRANEEEGIEATDGLGDYVTIYGDGRININTAPLPVLQSLHEDIDESLAQEIVEYRKENHFEKISDLKEVFGLEKGIYKDISPLITVKSSFFSVQAVGSKGAAKRRIETILEREGETLKIRYWRIR